MKNNSARSWKKAACTTILSVLSITFTGLPNVSAEGYGVKSALKENIYAAEARMFSVSGKGDVVQYRNAERRGFTFSPYEPTGLYAKPNEVITINVSGTQSIQAYIGTFSYDASWREDSKIKSFTLTPGTNTIQSSTGGMIYFYNKQTGGTIQTSITSGGTPTPYFILGTHTKQDLINMLNQYPNAHAVELKGERVLITASPARVSKYLLGSNTDPAQLLQKLDEAIRVQDKLSGLSEAQVDKHYIHYVEDNHSLDYYMYAFTSRTAYVENAIQHVLDLTKFTTDGWGPWHETGHMRQQEPWKFYNMGEVQVNIYSLAVQKAFGQPSRLEREGVYTKAFQYFEQSTRNYDEISDLFVKVVMLWQLHLAYGEGFYPALHQLYRDMPSAELPQTDEAKKQLFMITASKAAKQNLIPFFEKWGLRPSSDTIQKVQALGYPSLTAEIWKSTDSNPIKVVDTTAPTAPSQLQASSVTDQSVTLTWTKSTDNVAVTEYVISQGNVEVGRVSGSMNSFTKTALQPNTSYTYTVKAVDGAGNISSLSNTVSVITKGTSSSAEPWDPAKVYVQGMRVQYNGMEYEALWWTQGITPDTLNGWKLVSSGMLTEWNAAMAYTGGNVVLYQGVKYKAKWWTKGEIPGQAAVWERIE
ncbi:M60 family metallopeptidase [Ectobacillus sp. JY-23]|nr:M60 family metallopeptidase [Ectobacillus sp. JY-23]UOY92008.1 M60 family metallopeptidase [Ectobacillus sp. JY-23]